MTALERNLRHLGWAPRLAFAVFVAAGAVLVLQQWLYHSEYRHYLARERACRECPRPQPE